MSVKKSCRASSDAPTDTTVRGIALLRKMDDLTGAMNFGNSMAALAPRLRLRKNNPPGNEPLSRKAVSTPALRVRLRALAPWPTLRLRRPTETAEPKVYVEPWET